MGLIAQMLARMARFRRDQAGVTAVTFALLALLLICVTFAAIDASRVSYARSRLQDALDASILAAAQGSNTDATLVNTIGTKYMAAQVGKSDTVLNLKSSFTLGTKTVTGTATADVDPIFMDALTGTKVHLTVNAEVVRGQDQTIELAMVLDTTGSMSGTKIATLKTAAASMATKLFNGNTKGEVKIAVVPFAQYVNMGIASRTQSWANVPADYSTTSTSTPSCTSTTCTNTPYSCTAYNDGVPYQTTCYKSSNCVTKTLNPCPGPVTNTSTYKFQGCYGSPAYPDNVRDTNTARKYPGFLNLSCSKQVTPLTTSLSTVTTAINALTASGQTYIPAGLAWGFNVLSPQTPVTDGAAYDVSGPNRKPRKVLLLMTDGANTMLMRASNGAHDVSPATGARAVQTDTWTSELCTNIKAQKIEVYSVAFDIGGDAVARDLVRKCATDDAHFYDAADSAALIAAFDAIAQSLQALHISK